MFRPMITACAAAMLLTMSATPTLAQGQPMDARTEFTFNQKVEMPGVTLPPGTYIFRFVDGTTGRKVMQVQAKDASSKTYGMFLTINAQRPRPSDDAELRFLETPAGQPAAVKTWWYPGNTIGREFIYPKSQARPSRESDEHDCADDPRGECKQRPDEDGGPRVCLANGTGHAVD